MKPILIKGAHIIDPSQQLNAIGSILIAEGKIAWLGTGNQKPATNDYEMLDGKGLIAAPGFIDLHCHLRDPARKIKNYYRHRL